MPQDRACLFTYLRFYTSLLFLRPSLLCPSGVRKRQPGQNLALPSPFLTCPTFFGSSARPSKPLGHPQQAPASRGEINKPKYAQPPFHPAVRPLRWFSLWSPAFLPLARTADQARSPARQAEQTDGRKKRGWFPARRHSLWLIITPRGCQPSSSAAPRGCLVGCTRPLEGVLGAKKYLGRARVS